jgi:hypothetical protein
VCGNPRIAIAVGHGAGVSVADLLLEVLVHQAAWVDGGITSNTYTTSSNFRDGKDNLERVYRGTAKSLRHIDNHALTNND